MNKNVLLLMTFLVSSSLFSAEKLPVIPSILQESKSQEIGSVIKSFLPSKEIDHIDWSYKANDPNIIWIHKPYVEERLVDGTIQTIRKGIFRSNVIGRKTTYLYDKKYELPWSVIYQGGLAKFGVTEIQFHPNLPNFDIIDFGQCFGTEYTNCEFSPFISLKKAGVISTFICRDNFGSSSNFEKVYLLSAQGKKPTYAIYSMSTGSGGSTTNFRLMINTTKKQACDLVRNF